MPGIWAATPVPDWTTVSISWVIWAAVWGEVAVIHGLGWYLLTTWPWELETWSRMWGVMITPPLAIPAAARAMPRGTAWTFSWPMADLARPGRSFTKLLAGGK